MDWLWPARSSTQAVATQRPVIMGHPLLFGCLAQQSLGASSWCLNTTWESDWQPNCHQPLKRDGVWRQARPPKHQDTSWYHTHKIKTNNLSHIFIYDFIITFIKSYNCSHNYNIINSSSQLHHREIFVSLQVTINESLAQDEKIVDTTFASDIKAEWVPWKHQTHQVQA
jgi:hypothetical protein